MNYASYVIENRDSGRQEKTLLARSHTVQRLRCVCDNWYYPPKDHELKFEWMSIPEGIFTDLKSAPLKNHIDLHLTGTGIIFCRVTNKWGFTMDSTRVNCKNQDDQEYNIDEV